jgi:DNA-binding NtrC family response regulator
VGEIMEKINVLLVDDEVDFLSTITKRLAKRGLNTIKADTGSLALELLKENDVDVVVLDMKMPGMDGIDTLKEIKRQNPLVEVIMLTGHASVEAAIKGMELGAFDYLMKPTEIDELCYKLEDAYHKKILQEQKIKQMKNELK